MTASLSDDLAEGMRLMRRIQRRRLRRYGPTKPAIPLPELDGLELPLLLPGQRPLPSHPDQPAVRYFRPDGSPILGPFPMVAMEAEGLLRADRTVARTSLFRAGTRLLVSTVFLPLDHNLMGEGPPILWETMVFHGGTRSDPGVGQECWRYASREAALAGHRTVVATLREVQVLRRMADVKPLRPVLVRSPRLARLRAAYGAAW